MDYNKPTHTVSEKGSYNSKPNGTVGIGTTTNNQSLIDVDFMFNAV